MYLRSTFIIAVLTFSGFLIGCGGETANSGNTTNTANSASNNPLETTKASPASETTNDAPTLTPLFKAYCAAKTKNDEAAMRKLYTAGTIKSFEEQMKDDKIKTLTEFLSDEKVSGKCEVKNERVTGDTAVATIVTDTYPNGFDMYFEKENGEWKMTNKSPTFEASKSGSNTGAPASNSNSTK